MTSSSFTWEPCFRARIKNEQNGYQDTYKFFQKTSWGRHYCQGLGQNSLFSNLNSFCYDYYVSNSVIRVVVKFCWSAKIIFRVFCVFFLKTKRRTGGGIWKLYWWTSYCYSYWNSKWLLFYLVLAGNNEFFRVTPSTSSGQYRYSVSGEPVLTTVLDF